MLLIGVVLFAAPVGAMSDAPPADRGLWDFRVSFIENLNDPYQEAWKRLREICGSFRPPCFHEHHRPRSIPLGPVFARPDSGSKPSGTLVAVLRFSERRRLHYALRFRPRGGASRKDARTWRANLGDWGYGKSFPVTKRRGRWVWFSDIAGGDPGWVHARRGPLQGYLSEATHQVWNVKGRVEATRVATGRSRWVRGSIFLLDRTGDVLEFRPEIPSDMACGRSVTDPDTVPRYRAPLDAFLDERGRVRLEDAYPRGC